MDSMHVFFSGDLLVPIGYSSIFSTGKELLKSIQSCDVASCNFEGPIITDEDVKAVKRGPSLGQGIDMIEIACQMGFNLFNLANNHIYDYGYSAVKRTIKQIEKNGAAHIGFANGLKSEEKYYTVLEINGIKTAFFSAAEAGFGCEEWTNEGYIYFQSKKLFEQICTAKQNTDFVVVQVHAGAEGFELPLPELRDLYKYYIDCGADIVIGHHPHIIQGAEQYKEKWIYYSLGNFVMIEENSDYEDYEYCGLCLQLEVKKSKEKIDYQINRIYTKYDPVRKTVEIVPNEMAEIKFLSLGEKLCNDDYIHMVEAYCYDQYEKIYKNIFYRGNVCNIWDARLIDRLKLIVKVALNRLKFDDCFLLHNIGIDTHRWIVQRAINYGFSSGQITNER